MHQKTENADYMKKVDFDKFQDQYNDLIRDQVRFFDKNDAYFAEYKIKIVKRLTPHEPARILEYGCGIGRNLVFLRMQYPKAIICGCDISEKSLEAAAQELPGATLFKPGEKGCEGAFDLIFVANVMHHIAPAQREIVMRDIYGMLKDNGILFIFEHNPFNPVTRHLVSACPFDEDAVLLRPRELKALVSAAGLSISRLNYTLFFPSFLKVFRFCEPLLARVPLGGQYFIMAKKV